MRNCFATESPNTLRAAPPYRPLKLRMSGGADTSMWIGSGAAAPRMIAASLA